MSATHSSSATCPHIRFRDVLGADAVAALLSYVHDRQSDFQAGLVRNRNTGERRPEYRLRSSVSLPQLGPFKAFVSDFVCRNVPAMLSRLHVAEAKLEPRDFEITAFRDGDRFGAHIDTDERMTRVRVLSCVYYFAQTPHRFSGGELRLYGLPTLSAAGSPDVLDVAPDTDTMVVFPSWLRHEVLPVQVPSGAWMDSRFTINCWLHRVAPADAQAAS